ncbi:MAG: GTP-binding protein [Candidatus Lokiarchaeota archaeon]|nr:GTP-binding protein [Candidatus Harpocratesius repetitus]
MSELLQKKDEEKEDLDLYSNGKLVRHIKKKILILGEGGVGKTTLLYRYINNIFIDSTKMTIGSDFFIKKIRTVDEEYENRLTMLLWDFAGQDRFRFIVKEYTKGAEGVILVFDLVRLNSLQRLHNWIEILKEGGIWGNPDVKFFLVGTKSDLIGNGYSKIPDSFIEDFREEFSISKYFETSAKNGVGIENLFEEVAQTMIGKENEK